MSLFIRDWEVVSPVGVGKADFIQAVQTHMQSSAPSAGAASPVDPLIFTNFDKKTYLGKKGVRGMDGLGAFATVASALLAKTHPALSEGDRSRVGVVLGTATGGIKTQVEFIRDLLVEEQVEWVDPIKFPQTVMNCAASQIGIWHGFRGLNVTVSSGHHSGATAFDYAANALGRSRADHILVGCVEEYSDYSRFQLPADERGLRETHRLGEGCAMFLAQHRRTDKTDVEVVAAKRLAYFSRYDPQQKIEKLSDEIARALAAQRIDIRTVKSICFNRFSSVEMEVVRALASGLTGGDTAALLCSNDVVGGCVSATVGLQVSLLLAKRSLSDETGGYDLALAFDPAGGVAIVLLRYREEI